MNWLRMPRWSPYVAGTLIGVLSWIAFLSVDKPIGVSTAVAKTMGMLERVVAPAHVDGNAYFQKFKPAVDWEWMLVLGVALGAWLSSRLSGDKPPSELPPLWRQRFGVSKTNRYIMSFYGGVLLMLGARIAGGCTSGHGISGSLQLALSSWIFFLTLFVSGLLTAAIVYRREARRG